MRCLFGGPSNLLVVTYQLLQFGGVHLPRCTVKGQLASETDKRVNACTRSEYAVEETQEVTLEALHAYIWANKEEEEALGLKPGSVCFGTEGRILILHTLHVLSVLCTRAHVDVCKAGSTLPPFGMCAQCTHSHALQYTQLHN